YKVIQTTSPFDGESLWAEIFPKPVSKASGVEFLCNLLKIKNEETIVVGNDFNDIDMLNWANNAFVTANAPEELRKDFRNIDLNTKDAIAKLIEEIGC
ncbi:MAG: HAD family phosphatase, partial [Bacteroidales bacterium]|nr:HAD family phosphatase [Bacteroidales bacterium]